MNSIQKGDILEKKVFDLIKALVETGDFCLNHKMSKIFWKKEYYSESRKANIIFDIAIETYQKGADKPSIITLFECKNYKNPVPVKDIEAFDSKLNQVGEHKTKGYFITSSSYQKAALELAISKGMGVAIIKGDEEFQWLNYRKDKKLIGNNAEMIQAQLTRTDVSALPFFCSNMGWSYESVPDMLIDAGIIDRYYPSDSLLKIDYKEDKDIEERISEVGIYRCYTNSSLNVDSLCELVSELYEVDFIFSESLAESKKSKILGKIIYDPLQIFITKELQEEPKRLRFTLCHEIGHLVLHYHLLKPYFDFTIDTDYSFSFNHNKITTRLEIQANMFASIVLLPFQPLLTLVGKFFLKNDIYKGHLLLDHQSKNQVYVYTLLSEIEKEFDVSKEVAKIRLKELGLIKDKTNVSISNIMREKKLY
ncbi:MAG: hypothetical protein JWQ40_5052 [Segetibacter sp.]|nr:hypothetical protein [Segetibacter sp.]